jgi:hypothetical protein
MTESLTLCGILFVWSGHSCPLLLVVLEASGQKCPLHKIGSEQLSSWFLFSAMGELLIDAGGEGNVH